VGSSLVIAILLLEMPTTSLREEAAQSVETPESHGVGYARTVSGIATDAFWSGD